MRQARNNNKRAAVLVHLGLHKQTVPAPGTPSKHAGNQNTHRFFRTNSSSSAALTVETKGVLPGNPDGHHGHATAVDEDRPGAAPPGRIFPAHDRSGWVT